MASESELHARVRALEDLEAIRKLKARYFHRCDHKDPQGMRECFVPGKVAIDYGAIGAFDDRDQLVDVFRRLGCHEHILEMHHGVNPQIDLIDAGHARGTWGLHYQQIDTREHRLTQLGAYYEDEYRKVDGEWKVSATRCVVTSTLVLDLGGDAAKVLFSGSAASAGGR